MAELTKYIVFPMGSRRYAVPAAKVAELAIEARPPRTFPHTTPSIEGVLVRRNRLYAVCDIAPLLGAASSGPRRFYLIAECRVNGVREPVALPVMGECMLVDAAGMGPTKDVFAVGTLSVGGETIPVLNLDELIAYCTAARPGRGTENGR